MLNYIPLYFIQVNTSEARTTEYEENGVFKFILQRPALVFGDTGWYSCADESVDIIPNGYDDPEVNWLYVYVRCKIDCVCFANIFPFFLVSITSVCPFSFLLVNHAVACESSRSSHVHSTHYITAERNLFVEAEDYPSLDVFTGDDVVVPCRPTSPDLNVTMISVSNNDTLTNKSQFEEIKSTLIIPVLERLASLKTEELDDRIVLGKGKGSLLWFTFVVLALKMFSEPSIREGQVVYRCLAKFRLVN